MRYSVMSKGLSVEQLREEALRVGATDIKEARLLGQIFCEMDETQVEKLSKVHGLAVKALKTLKPDVIAIPGEASLMSSEVPSVWDVFSDVRNLFTPPLTGEGLTVAVVDTGIYKTHISLRDKIVYEEDFSGSGNTDDVFSHGTQVAFVIAGGQHGYSMAGVAPGAKLMNIKVLGDEEEETTEEQVVEGIERVCELVLAAISAGYAPTDPMWPNVINLSLGAEDDGDPDSPMRAACRIAVNQYGLDVVAAAGNYGPNMSTITSPATDPDVIAVGAIQTIYQILIWEKSSRGPTKEGVTKPDFVFWGVDIEAASSVRDDGYVVKSGTSFSAPMLSGLTGLLWETGRRVYGDWWMFRWIEAREFAPYYCLKPEDAPVIKGNVYGYGLPAMATIVSRLIKGGEQVGIESIIMPIMLMAVMAGMMKSLD